MSGPELRSSNPSPLLLGIDSLLAIRADQLGFYHSMRAKHGDHVILRLGPYKSHLFFHPDHIEAVLARNARSFIRFKKLMNVIKQWNGNSLLVDEGESWRVRRRKVLPAFQTRRLAAYGRAAVVQAEQLCRSIRETQETGTRYLEIDAVMAKLTLDIATRTLFGVPPRDNGFEVERALQILSETAFAEATSPISLPDWLPVAQKRKKRWAMRIMDDMVSGLVRSGLAGKEGTSSETLLDSLAEHHKGDFVNIRNDVMSLLIAGHETSGALLSWLFACMAAFPESLQAVQSELEEVLAGASPTPEVVPKLPILQAAINETLRLYPPAYSLFLREAIEPVDVNGVMVEKGDLVQIVPFTTQRDARFFPDPETFDPRRFLREPTWPKYGYLPFGAGPRVCIGQNFGLMETCLVAATILQRMTPLPIKEMPTQSAKFSLRPAGGLMMEWRLI